MIHASDWGIWQWVLLAYLAADWGLTAISPKTRQKLVEQDERARKYPFTVRASVFVGAGLHCLIILAMCILGGFFK